MAAMVYVKSLAVGLLAGVAAMAVQAVAFYRSWSFSDDGGGVGASVTNIYAAPVVLAAAAGSLVTWWRLRAKTLRAS